MKTVDEMTQAEFRQVTGANNLKEYKFDCLIILPERSVHDSGYGCMSYIACIGNKPVVKLAGNSDVLHLNGIGGRGERWN